jgi:hypothetical protein
VKVPRNLDASKDEKKRMVTTPARNKNGDYYLKTEYVKV